jgi:MFS family permease
MSSQNMQPTKTLWNWLQLLIIPAGVGFMLAIGAAELALFVSSIGIGALLVPFQIGQLAPTNKIVALSLFTGISVLIALVSNPVAGARSDRTTSRFGRRRPWIFWGGILTAASLFLMMQATTPPLLFIGWCGIQLFSNSVLAAVSATIPDRVPEKQRGQVSAIFGLGVPPGGIVHNLTIRST